MKFTERKAKANEEQVLELVNKLPGSKFKLHRDHYSAYDIGGTSDGKKAIIEVKERRQAWNTWYIEVDKINYICKQIQQEGGDCKEFDLYLCYSVDGKHFLYKINDISKSWKTIKKYMNKRTAQGFARQGEKVEKECYEFPFDSYMVELSDMSLGINYL